FEGFEPSGLGQRCGKGNIANLEQLRSGEKHHVGRIAIDGIDQASLVDDESLEARLLRLDGASHAGGPSAYDQDVARRVGPRVSLSAGQSFRDLFGTQKCQAYVAWKPIILAPCGTSTERRIPYFFTQTETP